ncbi:MAG: hypothetical protein PHX05_07685 [Acidobacteriota bacterium]|nr:hypothetical protein [Acidobacteriota bacterium]
MIVQNITADKEQWLLSQIKPAPEVFVLAYAGTAWKEWKIVAMCSHEEFLEVNDWERRARDLYPSALLVKVYRASNAPSQPEP